MSDNGAEVPRPALYIPAGRGSTGLEISPAESGLPLPREPQDPPSRKVLNGGLRMGGRGLREEGQVGWEVLMAGRGPGWETGQGQMGERRGRVLLRESGLLQLQVAET